MARAVSSERTYREKRIKGKIHDLHGVGLIPSSVSVVSERYGVGGAVGAYRNLGSVIEC